MKYLVFLLWYFLIPMNMLRYPIFILLFLVIFLAVFLFTINRGKSLTDLEENLIIQPVEQSQKERVWQDIQFNHVASYSNLINPTWINTDRDGFIYTADFGEAKVSKINLNGELIEKFGRGRGNGPGEFNLMTDLKIDHSNRIWVPDPRNARITIFSEPDSFKIIDSEYNPSRANPVDPDHYLIRDHFGGLIIKSIGNDETVMNVQPVISNTRVWSYVLDNEISQPASDGSSIVTYYYTNFLLKYSKHGKIEFFRKPIEPSPLPVINPPASGSSTINSIPNASTLQETSSPAIQDSTFHVLVQKREKPNAEWLSKFVDVYDFENGDYLYSYHLPESNNSYSAFTIYNEYFIALNNTDIPEIDIWKTDVAWNYKSNQNQ